MSAADAALAVSQAVELNAQGRFAQGAGNCCRLGFGSFLSKLVQIDLASEGRRQREMVKTAAA
jgi:hypothetical protein